MSRRKKADAAITRLEPLAPRGLRLHVHLDDGSFLEVALEALERLRLGAGDVLTAGTRRRLEEEDLRWRLREAALRLLSYRARSRAELRRRLRRKGFAPGRIDECLDDLEKRGFLDDEAMAAAFVRDRLRHRPRGRDRLISELREKGVPFRLAARVVERVLEDAGRTERDLALEVAEKWLRSQNPQTLSDLTRAPGHTRRERARRRLYGYLSRRGFRGEALRAAMERAEARARSSSR